MRCCRFSPRNGFTLLEVVIGLTLMASVLVGALLSFAAHRRQRELAEAKLAAVSVADDLLGVLSASQGGIPLQARGLIANRPGWFWQTSLQGVVVPAQIPMRVVRFQIIRQRPAGEVNVLVSIPPLIATCPKRLFPM